MSDLAIIDDETKNGLVSENVEQAWQSFKRLSGLENIPLDQERDILKVLIASNLNPVNKEVFVIPFDGWNSEKRIKEKQYTLVLSYQTLLRKAYEQGFDTKDFKAHFELVTLYDPNNNFRAYDDLACTVTATTSDGKSYSYTGYFSQYAKRDKNGNLINLWKSMPNQMLKKCVEANLFRTLPFGDLQKLPYIREEVEGGDAVVVESIVNNEFEKLEQRKKAFLEKLEKLKEKGEIDNDQYFYFAKEFNRCLDENCLKEKGLELKAVLEENKIENEKIKEQALKAQSEVLEVSEEEFNQLESNPVEELQAFVNAKKGKTSLGFEIEEKDDTSLWDEN